jgi:hypothetical protein
MGTLENNLLGRWNEKIAIKSTRERQRKLQPSTLSRPECPRVAPWTTLIPNPNRYITRRISAMLLAKWLFVMRLDRQVTCAPIA